MQKFSSSRLLCCIAGLLLLTSSSARGEESVNFRFNPPTPLKWVETLDTTITREIGGESERPEIMRTRTEFELVREGEGFLMTVQPLAIRRILNGRERRIAMNPLEKLPKEAVFTYELDSNGAVISLKAGYEEVMAKLARVVVAMMEPLNESGRAQMAQKAHAVTDNLKPEVVLSRMREQWNPRVAAYSGRAMMVGEVHTQESSVELDNGESLEYIQVEKLESRTPCGDRQCARIIYRFDTHAEALEGFSDESSEDSATQEESSARYQGHGVRVVDPETLLIRSERREQVIKIEVTGPDGQPLQGIEREIREYQYAYPQSGDAS